MVAELRVIKKLAPIVKELAEYIKTPIID